MLTGENGFGQSDVAGYFQIDVAAKESIAVRRVNGSTCQIELAAPAAAAAIFDAGRVACR